MRSAFVGIGVNTSLGRRVLASSIYNKLKLALAARHKAGLEFMRSGLGAGCEQGFEQLSLEICATALNDVPVSHGLTTSLPELTANAMVAPEPPVMSECYILHAIGNLHR